MLWDVLPIAAQHVGADDTVLDVGANIGEFTLFAARRASKVVAFEPVSYLFDRLSGNVALNDMPQVQLVNAGLYDREAKVDIYLSDSRDQLQGTNHGMGNLFSAPPGSRGEKEQIQVLRLDDWAQQQNLQGADFVKLDIEGAEFAALRGAEAVLREFRPALVLELEHSHSERAGFDESELLDYLRALDYQLHTLDAAGKLQPLQGSQVQHARNLYCEPPS